MQPGRVWGDANEMMKRLHGVLKHLIQAATTAKEIEYGFTLNIFELHGWDTHLRDWRPWDWSPLPPYPSLIFPSLRIQVQFLPHNSDLTTSPFDWNSLTL